MYAILFLFYQPFLLSCALANDVPAASREHKLTDFVDIVQSIVMRDRDTGRSRGFGFVTYSTADEANAAIGGLNEQELDGRRIKVNLANARGGGGGGGGGRCLISVDMSRF